MSNTQQITVGTWSFDPQSATLSKDNEEIIDLWQLFADMRGDRALDRWLDVRLGARSPIQRFFVDGMRTSRKTLTRRIAEITAGRP